MGRLRSFTEGSHGIDARGILYPACQTEQTAMTLRFSAPWALRSWPAAITIRSAYTRRHVPAC